MTLLLVFAAVLLLAVLLSALAHRTVLSTAVVFLVAGFLAGEGMLGLVPVQPQAPIVATLAELALFAVLFSDGMRVGWADLRAAWRLPGRALGLGLPLTLLITAMLAHYVAGLGWVPALLIGAVLAPTDPVFAAALVGNDKVPARLRHLLNVESGVNDGLALPFVVVLLAVAAGSGNLHLPALTGELLLGIGIGVAVPWVAIRLEGTRLFAVSERYLPLNAVAIGLLVLALAKTTHANSRSSPLPLPAPSRCGSRSSAAGSAGGSRQPPRGSARRASPRSSTACWSSPRGSPQGSACSTWSR